MKFLPITAMASLFMITGLLAQPEASDYLENWPQWRGPMATGVAPHATPPVEWSEDKNVRWKVDLPGKGNSSPIIWQDVLYVLTAVGVGDKMVEDKKDEEPAGDGRRRGRRRGIKPDQVQQFTVFAIDRNTGKTVWSKVAREELPHEGTHRDGTWSANSPVTDGEMLYAYFGSRGLYAYDFEGDLKWEADFGNMTTRRGFGEGSSPVIHGDIIVLNWDHEEDDFIVALNKKTGKEIWRNERDEPTSWFTPLLIEQDGQVQVITSSTNQIISYDLKTGETIWTSTGMTVNSIPSPVNANGLVYMMSGFRGSALQAVRYADASGNVKGSDAIVWEYNQDTPYVPSPLLYDNNLYFFKVNTGILTNLNATSGEPNYSRQRLDHIKNVYSSPVGANGYVYLTGREGATMVLKNGSEFTVVASNELDDSFDASAAIVGDAIFLRGHENLYCIGE